MQSINFLRQNNSIVCNKQHNSSFYNSCQIGENVKFYDSISSTTTAFNTIHADLWTSPIYSSSGHKYYLVPIDDFTHYVWIVPLTYKSSAYEALLDFHAYVKTQFERPIKVFQSDHGRDFDNIYSI